MIGIYKITSPTNKVYIGQSLDIERRRGEYRLGWCHIGKLKNSIKKHGFENHKFEIEEECEVELLNERERHYQDFYDVLGPFGLNLILQQTEEKKLVRSKETCKKLSLVHLGKKKSTKHIESLIKAQKKYFTTLTEEEKVLRNKKNSEVNKGRPPTTGSSRKVINTITEEIFNSITLAAKSIFKPEYYLNDRLSGRTKNNTNFKYYTNE